MAHWERLIPATAVAVSAWRPVIRAMVLVSDPAVSTGLHLLDHVGGTRFLMPENWDTTHRLTMINDGSDLRFELTA